VPFARDGVYGGFEGVAPYIGVSAGGVACEKAEEAGGKGLCKRDEGRGAGGSHPGGGWGGGV